MGIAHSEMLGVTVNGNIITFHDRDEMFISGTVCIRNQVNVVWSKGGYDVSHPMTEEDHKLYAGLIHRANAQGKGVKAPRGGNQTPPDDDPTPPPGTPGMSKQDIFEHVRAMAA